MGAKVHKSLRLDNNLVERVEKLRNENEPLSNAMCRVMAVGCDTLEGNTAKSTAAYAGTRQERDENTQRLIEHLEREIERLTAEHEADRAAIADKDRQIADALEKAHELTDQAHTLLGMNSEVKVLPANISQDEETTSDGQPQPEKKKSWWRDWFGA